MHGHLRYGIGQARKVVSSRPPRPVTSLVKYRSCAAVETNRRKRRPKFLVLGDKGEGGASAKLRPPGQLSILCGLQRDINLPSLSSPVQIFERGIHRNGRTWHRDELVQYPLPPEAPEHQFQASPGAVDDLVQQPNPKERSLPTGKYSGSSYQEDNWNGERFSPENKFDDSGASPRGHRHPQSGHKGQKQVSKRSSGKEQGLLARQGPPARTTGTLGTGRKDKGPTERKGGAGRDKQNAPRVTANNSRSKVASLPWGNLEKLQEKGSLDQSGVNKQRQKLDSLLGNSRYGGNPNLDRGRQRSSRRRKEVPLLAREVEIPPTAVRLSELGPILSKKVSDLKRTLRKLGEHNVTGDTMVDPDTTELLALEFNLRTVRLKAREWDVKSRASNVESLDDLSSRPPVVTVMGHVDHGKTTLLDALRKANEKVAGTEAAGITQKIGAFSVKVMDSAVTFFDTPGHAAFKSMRQSTSRLTDIVLVVIAADDGLKTQTLEVLTLLKQFPNLAPVVAVTKIDRPGVDKDKAIDRISRELLQHEVVTENYGGAVPILAVSSLTGEGFDDLLEALLIQAEVMELRADEKAPGEGIVVDSSIVKGRGGVADVLVSWGKLKIGDVMVAGMEFGRVRSMVGSNGKAVKEAGASEPVRVVGLKGLPKMGDQILVVESEEQARDVVAQRLREHEKKRSNEQESLLRDKRAREERQQRLKVERQRTVQQRERAIYRARVAARTARDKGESDEKAAAEAIKAQGEAEAWIAKAQEAERRARSGEDDADDDDSPTMLNAILKAEGFGMLEAMEQVLEEVPQDEVRLNVIKRGVGPVTQSDVEAAAEAEAPVFAFNVKAVGPDVKALAQRQGVQIHTHEVIYRFQENIRAVMSSLLPADLSESLLGGGEVLEVFDTTGKQGESVMIAGISVLSGKLSRSHKFRVRRDDEVVQQGLKVASMQRFKDRVNEVMKGKECGIALEGFSDWQQGDTIECYSVQEVKRQL